MIDMLIRITANCGHLEYDKECIWCRLLHQTARNVISTVSGHSTSKVKVDIVMYLDHTKVDASEGKEVPNGDH